MMNDVLEVSPATKHEGLTEFAAQGYLLIDATYVAVNIAGPIGARNKAAAAQIQKDFPLLLAELQKCVRADTKLVLVKANVCRLLEAPLSQHGFEVLNANQVIPFPSNGQQPQFRRLIRQVLGRQSVGGNGAAQE